VAVAVRHRRGWQLIAGEALAPRAMPTLAALLAPPAVGFSATMALAGGELNAASHTRLQHLEFASS
jgi:hypothetical protein